METVKLRTRRYNPSDRAVREKLAEAISQWLFVVCAARPIPGLEAWEGDWCGGVFWAIGDNSFLPKWEALDAAQIELVSNAQLIREARLRLAEFKTAHPSYRHDWESLLARAGGDLENTVKGILQDACWNRSQ
jgi:hypothetical protein